MPAGRYSKQRRRKKDRPAATRDRSIITSSRNARCAGSPGVGAHQYHDAGDAAAAAVGSVVVRHSSGLTIETNAKLVHSTASLTRHSATPRDRTVSIATLVGALRQQPISTLYPELTEEYVGVLTSWKERFSPAVWTRMTKHGTDRTPRCVKEMNECAPVVVAVREALRRRASDESEPPATIVDLCSGFGFLGMLLSEVLEPGAVECIHLVDQMWPMANAKESGPTQITWEHIRAPGWPIPLRTRKTNLKKGAEMRQLEKYIIGSASGSVIVAGVHLCGALAIKAIELFNRRRDKIAMICLKPCCLPGRIHAAREESWTVRPVSQALHAHFKLYSLIDFVLRMLYLCSGQLGTTTIDAVDLYSDDSYTAPSRQKKHKQKQKYRGSEGSEPSTMDFAEDHLNPEAPRPMTRAEIIAANRMRQHEEPHDEMNTGTWINAAGPSSPSGQTGGQNQTHARFRRWGELLLAGVGGADELTVDPPLALDEQLRPKHVGEGAKREQDRNAGGLRKELKTVQVQSHHFQNLFVFATRNCCATCR